MSGDVRISGQQQHRPSCQEPDLSQQVGFNPAFVISHVGRVGSPHQHNAAAAFFARKPDKPPQNLALATNGMLLSSATERRSSSASNGDARSPTGVAATSLPITSTSFASILGKCPPPPPPQLTKKLAASTEAVAGGSNNGDHTASSGSGVGKVRVILRVANAAAAAGLAAGSGSDEDQKRSFFRMDQKKKQVTLLDPNSGGSNCTNGRLEETEEETKSGSGGESPAKKATDEPGDFAAAASRSPLDITAPKMFAFDGLFTDTDLQSEVSAAALVDILQAVVSGAADGTLFCFGHGNLGKSHTMIGRDESSRTIGVTPTAIAWLFRCLKERRERNAAVGGGVAGARFSVRVSALEIVGSGEELRDLLVGHGTETEPTGAHHQNGRVVQSLFQNQTEARASTPEKAGYFLDYALAKRKKVRDSHFVFTLHLYQHAVTGQHLLGGRTRLHLIDFGCCERTKTTGGSITQAGLSHVILGILNGQRHLPFKDSKVTSLLRECLGSVSCQVAMLAHVSPEPSHYSETLHTIQLASRIHRMRRRKIKVGSSSGGSGSGSSEENKRLGRPSTLHPDPNKSSSDLTTSTDPSSSEQSCDTVIYRGPRDDDGTDAESPPVYLPSLNSGDCRGVMSRVLRGSTAELPPAKYRSLDRKQARSPRLVVSSAAASPTSSQQSTPVRTFHSSGGRSGGSTGSLPRNTGGKMPLCGKVAGYRQPASGVLDQALLVSHHHNNNDRSHGHHNTQHQHNSHHTNHLGQHRLSNADSGLSSRSRGSDHQGTSKQEVWVDTVPSCDKDVITAPHLLPAYDPSSHLHLGYDLQSLYGYMDEQKKQMIQEWVEGQAHLHRHHQPRPGPPPPNLTGLESLAWLEAASGLNHAAAKSEYRVFTHFKMAESSTSSCSEEVDATSDPPLPVGPEMKSAAAPPPVPGERPPTTPTREPGRLMGKLEEPEKEEEEEQFNGKEEEVASQTSQRSRKSDMATNTEEAVTAAVTAREQDPYRACRKLPLPRRSTSCYSETEGGSIRTLDELYTHCEQLVETLSQASEELKVQCQNTESSAICSREFSGPNQEEESIDGIEIYEVSDGSEGSIEVVDRSCQATEDDISACLAALAASFTSPKSPMASGQPPPLRGQISQHPHHPATVDIQDFERVCEDMAAVGSSSSNLDRMDHEDFFSRKFDQLAKLHDLYQSVSSITARCQSRIGNSGGGRPLAPQQKSASFSLSGLLLTNLDSLSLPSNSSSEDVNSLCSEPAWGLKHQQQQNGNVTPSLLDWNRNTASLRSLDFFPAGGQGDTVGSLSNLRLPPLEDSNKGKAPPLIPDQREEDEAEERCDSPILEGIDSELAKYAQLRDLQQAYLPPDPSEPSLWDRGQLGGQLASLRHPDGASNPNLRLPQLEQQGADLMNGGSGSGGKFATLPRRSPGNGRSSSGSDPEETAAAQHPLLPKSTAWCDFPPNNGHPDVTVPNDRSCPTTQCAEQAEVSHAVGDSPPPEKPKKTRVAKFSRLLSTVRKISRSPSQVNKTSGGEDKLKAKTGKGFLPSKQQQADTPHQQEVKLPSADKLAKSSSSGGSSSKHKDKTPKNGKGTLLSNRSSRPEHRPENSSSRPGSRTRSQGVTTALPSPYSFPSRPVPAAHHRRQHQPSETSGSDSGVDCLPASLMRGARGKGAKNHNSHNSTLPSLNSSLSRRSQCFSSGYESIGLDTESIDSFPPAAASSSLASASPVPILEYDQGLVSRLDRSWRFQEVTRLKKQQEQLKAELSTAKSRINVDPNQWSFDLYTEASGLEPTDPNFVEAFQKETYILDKRVKACQAHVALTTCFDRKPETEDELQHEPHSSCTADCDPYWMCQDKMEKVLSEM